ncbi:MAG: hypothetical protein GY834_10390 [Bacteroidetes bacterium]|nr:hypothetical protein [Bacteroidota bacterium]
MKRNYFYKLSLYALIISSLIGCSKTKEPIEQIDGEDLLEVLAPGVSVATLEQDIEVGDFLWEEYGYLTGSNVEFSDGKLSIWVDEDGSIGFDGIRRNSEAGGIVISLDEYDDLVGVSFEVELELPAAYPEFNDGVGIAQTFGIFEKSPVIPQQMKGAFVNFGYCPGSEQFDVTDREGHAPMGGHHISFGGSDENIMNDHQADMGFGPLDKDLDRLTATIKMEIKTNSIAFSANGEEPYYVQQTNPEYLQGNEFELRIMTHAVKVVFGSYDPAGAPYITYINGVKINDKELSLISVNP